MSGAGIIRGVWAVVWALGMAGAVLGAGFESLGIPVRKGGLMGCLVGPDGKGGEALYFNFNQVGGTLFLVQVDPDTGRSRQFNAPEGPGAWAFVAGPDDRIYLGTWDGAIVLRFDPQKPDDGLVVIGKPSATESYLWQFDAGKDGWIYGCTYPQAKLVRFDPRSGKMEDLGRMHPREMYARSVAVGPTGKVYVGVGTQEGDLAVYDPATGGHRSVLPLGLRGAAGWTTVGVSKRDDGNVYAEFGTNLFRLDDEIPVRVHAAPERPKMRLRDGRVVTAFGRGTFSLRDPGTGTVVDRTFEYAGAGDYLFMVAPGPGNCVYGSTAMPLEVFRYDPARKSSQHLGDMPGGEVYSMLEDRGKLYMCYYGGSVMNLYDPGRPFWKFGPGSDCNPVTFGGVGDGHLRPAAMIRGPAGRIYVGSEPPYGELGGALGVWDPEVNRTVENYRHVVTNQSIVSLAWDAGSGLIYGGSAIVGGGGTKPVAKSARFFGFDPVGKRKVFEAELVAGADRYSAVAVAAGKIYVTAGRKLMAFDPRTREVKATLELPAGQVNNALGVLPSGMLVGLTTAGVYLADSSLSGLKHEAKAPVPVRCGFAVVDGAVYFGSGAELWRYRLPEGREVP